MKHQESVFQLDPREVENRVGRAMEHLKEVQRLLPGLPILDSKRRAHSPGRLRDKEPRALRTILDTVDAFPTYFGALADRNHGRDGVKVETDPARHDLARREVLESFAAAIGDLQTRVSDALLVLGEGARAMTAAAYRIGRTNADFDPKLAASLGEAMAFYGDAARARKRNAKKAARTGPSPTAVKPRKRAPR